MQNTLVLAALALVSGTVVAQTSPTESSSAPEAVANTPLSAGNAWQFSATVLTFFVQNDREYVQPIVEADRDWLHLEARFNYEGIDTGSLWVGVNLETGDEESLRLEFTPMLGVAAGDTEGVAPGYRGTLSWQRFEFFSEGEWLFDTENSNDSFFYNWSELTVAPIAQLRVGMATERTVLFQSDREIQRGLLLGYTGEKFDVRGIWFNPDDSDPIFVLSFGAGF